MKAHEKLIYFCEVKFKFNLTTKKKCTINQQFVMLSKLNLSKYARVFLEGANYS